MKQQIILLSFIFIIILQLNPVYAVCIVNTDKDTYSSNPSETVTATGLCTASNEKSQSYTFTYYNTSNAQWGVLSTQNGTTPNNNIGFFFNLSSTK